MARAAVPAHQPAGLVPPAPGLYPAHPLAVSVAELDRALDWISFSLARPGEAGWTDCERALADPGFFQRWREQVAQGLGEQYDEVPERTTGAYVLQWYLGVPTYLGAMLFHSARRVPSLHPRRLAFRVDPWWVSAVALRPGTFWCLPGDPDVEHPDAVAVHDEAELAFVLRREVVAHATRFLRLYGPLVRFGRRTLWASVTDCLDTALLLAGRSLGSERTAAADAHLVLAQRVAPFTSASTVCQVLDNRGRTHWTRRRGSCCFSYALPEAEVCATCPRVDDAERARLLGKLEIP